jgi:glycosyltransferase involved in cell wall biosynthesis
MKILFLGQLGLPIGFSRPTSRETRVLALANLLSEQGHLVTVQATPGFSPKHVKKWGRISVRHAMSFHPEKPGGWLYEFLSLITLWKLQPDVVHIQSFKAAVLSRLGALLSPQTTFVWTIDSLPSDQHFFTRLGLRLALGVMDVITCPSRLVQYRLLTEFGVRSLYIPDGYSLASLEPLKPSQWGLRKGQYVVTWVKNPASLSLVAKAYRKTHSRKKLVVLVDEMMPSLKRIATRYPFLLLISATTPRVQHSLISQAAVAIGAEEGPLPFLLQVMEAGVATLAFNYSLNQEVLGTTGRFVEKDDSDGLQQILASLLFYPAQRNTLGSKAKKRARAHFLWQRILEEYTTAYHYPAVRKVPVDSIQPLVRQSLA